MKNFLKISNEVPVKFVPRKVDRYPCLMYLINQIYNNDIREYSQILNSILYCKMAEIQIFIARVENCSIVCAVHLQQFLMTDRKVLCTSEARGDILFESLNRQYSNSCIRHCMKKICEIYPFRVFHELFF